MSQFLTRLLGERPGRTLIKLLILSCLVGLVLSSWGWKPLDVPARVWQFMLDLYHWAYSSFDRFFDMFLVGAMIVVPIFVIRRLLKKGKE